MEKQSFNIVYFKQILVLDLDEGSGLFFSVYCLKMHELSVNLSGTLHHPKYFIHDLNPRLEGSKVTQTDRFEPQHLNTLLSQAFSVSHIEDKY